MPQLSRLLFEQRMQRECGGRESGYYARALRLPVTDQLSRMPGLQLMPASMIMLITLLHWYAMKMGLVPRAHPPHPPQGSSDGDTNPHTPGMALGCPRTSRPRPWAPIGVRCATWTYSRRHYNGATVSISGSMHTSTHPASGPTPAPSPASSQPAPTPAHLNPACPRQPLPLRLTL
ncbi:hypothetical protein J4Q44_G00221890 [Coregonus suidteri]|uniref:Uncharacterized protein n=1 Tax=Coregonus suidteri TaxID=861788 RepID=A0AAN8QP84_9TELE